MIDPKLLRADPEVVRASQLARGEDPGLVDAAINADARWRIATVDAEEARAEQKRLGKGGDWQEVLAAIVLIVAKFQKDIAKNATEDVKRFITQEEDRRKQLQQLSALVKTLSDSADRYAQERDALLMAIQNIIEPGVPEGGEDDFAVLREVGAPRDFTAEGFAVRDHLEIGEALGAIDMERGAKVSGARFYYLTGIGARLELAILTAALDRAMAAGFTPVIPPTLVKPEIMRGTGFLGTHSDEVYRLEADDLYLTGTSEVALAGYHADEILDLAQGARRYVGWSRCYRREAGSHGRDTRGIIRVHEFHKVEMFSFCRAADAAAEHARFLELEEAMLVALELPYRVIDTAAGDLGASAARKFDCEAWLPSQARYMEVTSTSNCTTFQARRLGVRERTETGTVPVATVNGTIGTTRWIVALLENHQQPDGSVHVPNALRPYLGGAERLEPVI